MKYGAALFLALIALFSSIVYAQAGPDVIVITTAGTCRDFVVSVSAPLDGCWDVKIDAPGRVLHGEKWVSSFYYVENGFCDGDGEVKAKLNSKVEEATLKLRQNETIIEKSFPVVQDCPELTELNAMMVAVLVIVILLGLAALYKNN